jgi:hypothetical protein
MLRVIDTNVAVAANGRDAEHVSKDCQAKCARRLSWLRESGVIVLDDGWRIIGEYLRHLRSTGQPGPGDEFLRWVLRNQANPARCRTATISPRGDDAEDYEEFPDDAGLTAFDPSDRKFVAVSVACYPDEAPICVASDRGWWRHREALARHGVVVEFLCPDSAPP